MKNKSEFRKELHKIVWDKFIRMPYGHIVDYVGNNGEVFYPTAEECKKAIPNPLGWWTPIENGAFFTGLYLYALLSTYNDTENIYDKEIGVLVNGLKILQDVSNVDGFIARGLSDDGTEHYPFSSEDQVVPWILAMYSYMKSDLCVDKNDIKSRLLKVLLALKKCSWKIPCDVQGLYTNGWAECTDWRGVVKLIFCNRLIYELTGDEKDLRTYCTLLSGYPLNSVFSRKEIISHGYASDMVAFLGNKQTWICTCSHLAVREMAMLDEENRIYFNRCLYNNGVTALLTTNSMKEYDNKKDGFSPDWRKIQYLWEDYNFDVKKGITIALKQFHIWADNVVPHRYMEHCVLGNALFATYIAVTCGNEKIINDAIDTFLENCDRIDWKSLHNPYAFVAECALIFEDTL